MKQPSAAKTQFGQPTAGGPALQPTFSALSLPYLTEFEPLKAGLVGVTRWLG
jgi:hypothetical protein